MHSADVAVVSKYLIDPFFGATFISSREKGRLPTSAATTAKASAGKTSTTQTTPPTCCLRMRR